MQGQWVLASAVIAAALALFGWFAAVSASAAPVGCAWLGESDQRDVNVGAPDLDDAFYVQDELAPNASTRCTSRSHPHRRTARRTPSMRTRRGRARSQRSSTGSTCH